MRTVVLCIWTIVEHVAGFRKNPLNRTRSDFSTLIFNRGHDLNTARDLASVLPLVWKRYSPDPARPFSHVQTDAGYGSEMDGADAASRY